MIDMTKFKKLGSTRTVYKIGTENDDPEAPLRLRSSDDWCRENNIPINPEEWTTEQKVLFELTWDEQMTPQEFINGFNQFELDSIDDSDTRIRETFKVRFSNNLQELYDHIVSLNPKQFSTLNVSGKSYRNDKVYLRYHFGRYDVMFRT